MVEAVKEKEEQDMLTKAAQQGVQGAWTWREEVDHDQKKISWKDLLSVSAVS